MTTSTSVLFIALPRQRFRSCALFLILHSCRLWHSFLLWFATFLLWLHSHARSQEDLLQPQVPIGGPDQRCGAVIVPGAVSDNGVIGWHRAVQRCSTSTRPCPSFEPRTGPSSRSYIYTATYFPSWRLQVPPVAPAARRRQQRVPRFPRRRGWARRVRPHPSQGEEPRRHDRTSS